MRIWFLNLGPSSTTPAEADADIRAIAETDPALILGVEAIGKHPLVEPGYQQIVDITRPGRANVFAYVRDGAKNVKWKDCMLAFPRAEHPQLGPHPARSILRFDYQAARFVVAHKPPAWEGAGPARAEHDEKLKEMLAPWAEDGWKRRSVESKARGLARPRVLLWDCNGIPGAQALATRVKGTLVGDEIDNAIVRKTGVIGHGYHEGVGGHQFATDHPWGAFQISLDL